MKDKYYSQNKEKYNKEAPMMANKSRQEVYVSAYEKLIDRVNIKDTDTLLDIGCGTGNLAAAVASKVSSYKGIDISNKAIDVARKRELERCAFECVDLLEFVSDEKLYSKVIAISSIDQMGNKMDAIDSIANLVEENGLIYLEVRNGGYFVKKMIRPLVPLLEAVGLIKKYPMKGFVDISYNEWVGLFRENNLRIIEECEMIRPYYGDGIIDRLKVAIQQAVDKYCEYDSHYMLSFVLKRDV